MKLIKELFEYREMIFSLIRRELRGKYKGSVLGFAWTFINPLLQLLVYTFVFSFILRSSIEQYYLFLFVALIPWIFFSTSLSAGAGCIRAQGDMVKKIYFPREVIPISFVSSQFINMLLSFAVVFMVLILSGKGINLKTIIFLPLIMLIEYILVLGLTMIVSGLVVYLRDLEHLMAIITMVWQFMTPIMYDISLVPEKYLSLYNLNPMTPIIIAYRDILYFQKIPNLETLMISALFGIVIFFLGFYLFSRLKIHFAEEL